MDGRFATFRATFWRSPAPGSTRADEQGCKGKTEAAFLDVLDETVSTGKTAAENLLALYHGSWNGNIDRVFRDFAY